MNVLSLCDGISCGRLALQRAGLNVERYFSSEIDNNAIAISEKNWTDQIRLGDLNLITHELIDSMPQINLVMFGSPCQSFSRLGKQEGFDGKSGLFHICQRILSYIQSKNTDVKFLVENVDMKEEWKDIISSKLGVSPIKIDSRLLSPAKRKRIYWTNIKTDIPQELGLTFDDINDGSQNWIDDNIIRKIEAWKAQQKPLKNAVVIGAKQKLPCLTARGYNQYHSGMILITDGNGRYRYLTNLEGERAMTLPDGYTDAFTGKQSDKFRSHAIGNGWTVDVIAHILKGIK